VLDLGCGAGEPIARHLIAAGYAVTGVDASPTMIALCRSRWPDGRWVVADIRGLTLGRRFDGILAWDSFFHLRADDQRALFAVFRDHAAPGAALLFTSGPRAGVAMGTWQGEPLYHASLDPDEYRALLAAHGFAVSPPCPRIPPAARTPCGWRARMAGIPAISSPSANRPASVPAKNCAGKPPRGTR
jgi:SAM-dependent methyltransferase